MLLKHILDGMQEFLYLWQMYDVIVRLSYSFILIEMNDLFDFSHQGQNYSALWASEEN